MKIDAWWFDNTQLSDDILQPDFFIPKTHLGLFIEGVSIVFPINIDVTVIAKGVALYEKQLIVNESKIENEEHEFDISINNATIMGSIFAKSLNTLPEYIKVAIKSGNNVYSQDVHCGYATITGKITDFSGNPFPAVFGLYRLSFGGSIGVWSNKDREYSITVPKGVYNAFYVDDDSYRKTSLENWGWHMIVDRDEEHNFKVGNGEVYSLCARANNGGASTLFIFFRPMILTDALGECSLSTLRGKCREYQVDLNNTSFNVEDISPDLTIDDITVTINGYEIRKISLQKIYETGDSWAMPAYILQVQRNLKADGYSKLDKQTLVVEYDAKIQSGYNAQSQGRTQFFYNNSFALTLK